VDDDIPACIVAAERVRDASIDVAVATLLDAVAEALRDWLARRLPPTSRA
jgi:tryptophan synthase beta subunit